MSRRQEIRREWRIVGVVVAVVCTAALALTAVRADSNQLHETMWTITLDLAVGLVFIATAACSPGAVVERTFLALVGVTWLVASSSLGLYSLHQGLLILVLVAFPSGRARGTIDLLLVGVGVLVLLGYLSAVGVATVFAAVAATSSIGRTPESAQWYRVGAGSAVALTLFAIADAGRFDPRDVRTTYEVVLVLVALAFYVVSRRMVIDRERFADELIGDDPPVGFEGLASIVRDSIGDTELQIYRWRPQRGDYIDDRGRVLAEIANRDVLFVDDGPGHIAAVQHRSGTLDDPAVARAVVSTVQLTAKNVRLREELDARLTELEAARTRLLVATDRQRSATAARLRDEVVIHLQHASDALSEGRPPDATRDVTEAFDIAVQEISRARDEVLTLVSGVPPVALGDGRLPQAIEVLAKRSPVSVIVTALPGVAAAAEIETTLFYVCSEALTNAAKHSGAERIHVHIGSTDDAITVTVRDDGRGGVDVSGSGITGLADRVAARGGRLRVDSPPGAGTTITAVMPR